MKINWKKVFLIVVLLLFLGAILAGAFFDIAKVFVSKG